MYLEETKLRRNGKVYRSYLLRERGEKGKVKHRTLANIYKDSCLWELCGHKENKRPDIDNCYLAMDKLLSRKSKIQEFQNSKSLRVSEKKRRKSDDIYQIVVGIGIGSLCQKQNSHAKIRSF